MKKLKSQKGITLVTLAIYMVLAAMVISMLALLTRNFRENLDNVNSQTITDNEFDKINLQLLNETKKTNNQIITVTATMVEFKSGNIYEYNQEEKIIYQKNLTEDIEVKVAEKISNVEFSRMSENNRDILIVTVTIDGKQRTTEYVMAK